MHEMSAGLDPDLALASADADPDPATPVYVVPLASAATLGPAQVGAKAARLAALLAAGLPVPDGIVLTTAAFERFLDGNRLGPARPPDEVAAAAMPVDVSAALHAAAAALGDAPLAVRSSAAAEDLGDVSYAGQYETVLGVQGPAAIERAVRRCWASAFAERVTVYGVARGRTGVPAMAVLIQRLIEVEAAGVAFTANPVTDDRSEALVSAVGGLGERLVSGEASPDDWLVRDGRAECRRQPERAVTADQVVAIAALARRVEQHLSSPQDIEWALGGGTLCLLQARPITGLPEVVPVPPEFEVPAGFWVRDALVAIGDPTIAVQVAERSEVPANREYALSAIVGSLAREQSFAPAVEAAARIRWARPRAEALRDLACAHVEAGDFYAAEALVPQISDPGGRTEVLAAIALAQTHAGLTAEAEQALGRARVIASAIDEDRERSRALRTIAITESEVGTINGAIATARDLSDRGDRVAALAAIGVRQARTGDDKAAELILAEAEEAVTSIEWDWKRKDALEAIATAWTKIGRLPAARETISRIDGTQWQAFGLQKLAETLAQAGDFASARATADDVADLLSRAWALKLTAQEAAKAGKFSLALEAAHAIPDGVHDRPRLLESVRDAATPHRDMVEWAGVAHLAPEDHRFGDTMRAATLADIAAAQGRIGDEEGAERTFAEALEYADRVTPHSTRASTLVGVGTAQMRVGQTRAARTTFGVALHARYSGEFARVRAWAVKRVTEFQEQSVQVSAVSGSPRQPDPERRMDQAPPAPQEPVQEMHPGASRAHTSARNPTQRTQSDRERVSELTERASAQHRAGQADAARATLATALDVAQGMDEGLWYEGVFGSRSEALRKIAVVEAWGKDFRAAEDTIRMIGNEWDRAWALEVLALAQARSGLGEQTVQTVERITADRSMHIPIIANALVEGGSYAAAKLLLGPASYYIDSAYRMCVLLARMHPSQASSIADILAADDDPGNDDAVTKAEV